MKLLIVEDERELSESIVCFLRHEDYLCEQAFTYDEAMLRVAVYEYDCVLLDLMLPGGTGLDVLRKVKRAWHRKPVSSSYRPRTRSTTRSRDSDWVPTTICRNLSTCRN